MVVSDTFLVGGDRTAEEDFASFSPYTSGPSLSLMPHCVTIRRATRWRVRIVRCASGHLSHENLFGDAAPNSTEMFCRICSRSML